MDLLEHPLEAVAFRLYSLPIPGAASAATGAAAWTCVAAVLAAAAAAAGLWRLRSSTSAAVVVGSTKPLELEPSPAPEVSPDQPAARPSSQWSPDQPAAAALSPKERYTAYYRDDAGCVGCCDVGDEDGDEEEEEEEEDDDDDVAEEHKDGGRRDVFVSDGADPFGWEVVRSLPLSPTPAPAAAAAEEMERRRYQRRSPTTALSGSVVQLWDYHGAGTGGGLTPVAASPRRRGRVVVGAVLSAF